MRLTFCLIICLAQILLIANAMENRDDNIELFLSVRLPFSVKRDEIINVPVLLYNPLRYVLSIAITLDNSDAEYEIIDFGNKTISEPKVTKRIRLQDHSAGTVSFLIRPKVIGNVVLKFKGSTSNDYDFIDKTMNVVPEGITQYVTDAFLISLKNQPEENTTALKLELPKDLVPDSQHVEVGIVGDIMGLVLKNLDNLVRMPTDSGEQTMSSLLPNYLIMKYLKNLNRLTPIVEARLRHNLETGYQNILKCRHMDGSFSSFGPSWANENPQNNSTWLTAYVLRFLPHFKEFINVNETVIEEGLAYLSNQQSQNGTFTEKGDYLYPSQRNHILLTGAVVLAFLENPSYADKYLQNIIKGLEFMGKNLEKYKSLHIHTLATYASNMIKYDAPSTKKNLLKWLSETNLANQITCWHYVFLIHVEVTSYNLLKLLDLNSTNMNGIEPVVKHVIAHRKSLGGFNSMQNTLDGLTDLLELAEFADYDPAKMDINIISKDKNETIKVTEDNGFLYKGVELHPNSKSLKIEAKGNGSALVQIGFQYNTFTDRRGLDPSFTIHTIKLDDETKPSFLKMSVCVSYVGRGKSSNMALLEISTPSGYIILDEQLKEIQELMSFNKIELKNSNSLLVVYFEQLYRNVAICLTVEAYNTRAVAMQKPSPILIYDFYNTDIRTVAFYEVDSKLCDVCGTQAECSECK